MRHLPRLATLLLTLLVGLPLMADENDQPTWLGITLVPVEKAENDRAETTLGEPAAVGVMVGGVVEGSPAAEAGLRARDLIVSVDGSPVASNRELIASIRGHGDGSWVPLAIERQGRARDLRVRLGTRPEDRRRMQTRRGWIGISAIDLPGPLREHFGAPDDAGVMISSVEPGSPAEAAGFELGDVVYEMDGRPVRSRGDLKRLTMTAGVGNPAEFVVVRAGAEMLLEAVIEKLEIERKTR